MVRTMWRTLRVCANGTDGENHIAEPRKNRVIG
jgi:hypothetical protein